MIAALRWTLRAFLALLGLTVAVAFLGYYLAGRSLPDYAAEGRARGLGAPLEIVRDTANVPHILGQTDADSYFGLGYVHAQDRLWQMTMLRRTAQGKLSELFGQRTVGIDTLMRRLDLYRLAARSVSAQTPEAQVALRAYAAGVNAWIATVNEGARGRGAPEFFLFAPDIALWQPADSLAVAKLMGVQLSSQLQAEVLRASVALALPPERVADILPDDPAGAIAALPELAGRAPGRGSQWAEAPATPGDPQQSSNLFGERLAARTAGERRSDRPSGGQHATDVQTGRPPAGTAGPGRTKVGGAFTGDLRDDPLSPVRRAAFGSASNAWAAAPMRAATGGTLLANDPHLGLTAPSIWYLARLELSGGGVIGGTIPGLPSVLAGRNDSLGWGLTSAYADDQDLYIEEVAPGDPGRYRTPGGGSAAFRTERSILRIKDAPPQTLTLRWTANGPVLPLDTFDLGRVTPAGHVPSLAWTLLDPADTSVSASIALMSARTIDEATRALELHVAPAQNVVLVDGEGIAMQLAGALPRRDPAHESLGRLPSRGWREANRWQGVLPYADNPRIIDPPGGILGNTNNKSVDRPFPDHVSFTWGDTQRVHRWAKLMQDRRVHTRESFMEAQLDTVSLPARTLLPLIARDLWFQDEAAAGGTVERRRRAALELLADWNGEMNEHMPEPLIYAAWLRELQTRLIRDELGGVLAADLARADPLFIERVYRNVDGAGIWCDVVQSGPVEDCADMARRALDDALQWIDDTYGGSLESLQWGDAHQAQQDHPVLGDVPLLGWLVNIRQSTSGGDHTLMRGMTAGGGPQPFANVHAAGYRGIYDMADPDASLFVLSTGQSGHPLSRYYDNLGELWRRGEYIPMSLDVDLARAAAVGVTRLEPVGD